MKDSEINELESEKKDEGQVSEIPFDEKTFKGVDIQFDLSVPTEGDHITLSFKFCSESLNDDSQSHNSALRREYTSKFALVVCLYYNHSILIRTLIITLYVNLVFVLHDEALHSKEDLQEAKGEHKGEKVQILLEDEFYK